MYWRSFMEKKYSVMIALLTVVALFFSVLTTDNSITRKLNINITETDNEIDNIYFEVKNDYYVSKYGKISTEKWKSVDNDSSGFDNAKDFLTTVDNYVLLISDYIGMPNWLELHKAKYREDYYFEPVIDFSFVENDEEMSYAEHYLKLRIKLNIDSFEENFLTLARDITHIITGESKSPSLSEGLGFYIQDEIGMNVNKLSYGIDIFTCSKDYISDDFSATISRIGTTYGNVTVANRDSFYILSNSFCRYLIENYGMKKFMEVYKSEDVETAYSDVYNLSLEELKSSWLKYVENYDNYMELSKKYMTDKNKKTIKKVGTINNIDELGGSIKNKTFFILNKSFNEYLKKEYGVSKYNKLMESNNNYHNIYGKSVTELRNMWQEYVKGL